jgi:hypothetical protein
MVERRAKALPAEDAGPRERDLVVQEPQELGEQAV